MAFSIFLGMYGLTYIGRMFNGLTLVIVIWVVIFSVPKVYVDNKVRINFLKIGLQSRQSTVCQSKFDRVE